MNIYFDRIKPLFENSGLTDKEIEKVLKLPRGVIYKWGTGKYKSYMKYIPQIADFFQVTPNYLLGKIDDPHPVSELTGEGQKNSSTPEGAELDPDTIQLREIWDGADREERKALLAMAEMLKARRNK